MPKTKIICTLGPASDSESVLRKMMRAGMDVVRLNFSHGTHAEHQARIARIRRLNRKYRRKLLILQDLEGHRIRVGTLEGHRPLPLKQRQQLWVTTNNIEGTAEMISIDYRGPLTDIPPGRTIYIDDGKIALRVKRTSSSRLLAEVAVDGVLKEHKGVNIPDTHLRFPRLTDKDKADLEFGIKAKVDYIAQSFVRNSSDMLFVKKYVGKRLPGVMFIAKIENREGVRNIASILEAADGIMIARGDLGISLPIYEVPVLQKRIIRQCKALGKCVITATQMLESMVSSPLPTRAEASDVANAIIDGTDFVMLSAETAVGEYPVETVNMMNKIIIFTEQSRPLV